MITIRIANELALIRKKFRSFGKWKLESLVEKQVMDRRQQMFVVNNAKLEI